MAISESLHNEVDFDIERALAFDTLAMALMNDDDLPAAKANFERSTALMEKALGADSQRVGVGLNNIAAAMLKMHDYAGARPVLARALVIFEKQLGPDHPSTGAVLSNLGNVLTKLDRGEEAAPLLRRATHIAETSFGPWNSRVGVVSANLGAALAQAGKYDEAEAAFDRTREVYEKAFGPQSADFAMAETHRANNLALAGKTADAIETAVRSETIIRAYDEATMRGIPEREALLHASARNAGNRANGLNILLNLAAAHAPAKPALDQLIRSRANVFDEMAARHRASVSGDPEIQQRSDELAKARDELAGLVLKGQGAIPPAEYAAHLAKVRANKEQAERSLAEKSARFRQDIQEAHAGLEEVSAALPRGSVLVSYALYRQRNYLLNAAAPRADPRQPESFVAFVLHAGESDPVAVPLGAAEAIAPLVRAVRERISSEAQDPGRAPQRSEQLYRDAAARLRQKIWDPIAPFVAGAERVFIVPDGDLNLVNFAALPTGATAYLIENGPVLHYLSTERDLLAPSAAPESTGLLAVGNPAFDQRPQATVATLRGSNCSAFQNMHFDRLPDSAREVQDLAALWKQSGTGDAVALTGTAASKDAFFERAQHRRVLHLATHGFFLAPDCRPAGEAAANPLLLSGLVLAGANEHAAAGILTAEEIAGMNLEGVDWAVLSACDSALGEFVSGEGVFGLRRAFQQAGARAVIMSVWPADDRVTRSWMRTLYQGRFAGHLDTAKSVQAASLSLLKARRNAGESTHPLYWGGFIAAGAWR